jgi:hypothetical protein
LKVVPFCAALELRRDEGTVMKTKMDRFPVNTPYQAGFNAGFHGPNTTNSHFAWFSTRERTDEWERGKKDGEVERAATPGPRKTEEPPKISL